VTQVDPAEITSVTPRSPGGTLHEVAQHLERIGEPCAISPGGTQAWLQYPRGALIRFPLECTDPVDPRVTATLLRLPRVWVLNYLLAPDPQHPANCVSYVCSDPGYDIHNLDSKARQVRRGLRTFKIRLCTWHEWVERGFPAHAETHRRHSYAAAEPSEFRTMAARWKDQPFHEIWGAWQGDDLAAWLTVLKIDDWAMIDLARSRTESLSGRPNHSLLYLATRSLLVEEHRRYVSYGLSSVQDGSSRASLHNYKLDMGYEAIPMRRIFVSRPIVRPLLQSRGMSWIWGALSSAIPKSAPLRKLAGMSRALSRPGSREATDQGC
jgi:hypothetical protein